MRIKYQEWNPRDSSILLVDQANDIIDEYEADGYTLTLRQLYYQFVARAIIDNTERSYKNLGKIITNARMAGLISWEAIEDRNRELNSFWYDENAMSAVQDLPGFVRFDRWARQEFYVEVWVEKEALGNVIAKACEPWLVPHMACKGYLSASEAWRAGQRFTEKMADGKQCVMIHLGDHDPSGIDMTRDNKDRLNIFTGYEMDEFVDVRRIALNMDQVNEYEPPTNPTKLNDSRATDYIIQYGRSSWELDALEPKVLRQMIEDELADFIDIDKWEAVTEEENEQRRILSNVYDRWDEIEPIVRGE